MINDDILQNIIESLKSELNQVQTATQLEQDVKLKFLGKNSKLQFISDQLKSTANIEEKKTLGKSLNFLKQQLESLITSKREELEKFANDTCFDVKAFEKPAEVEIGTLHFVTTTINEICKIFNKYGFEINLNQEVETDFYNFTGLNIPDFHPARQMQDTFYVDCLDVNQKLNLLRTHTTAASLRYVQKNTEIPVKSISFGKVFRVDSDRTHSPMFHQFELVYIDKNANLSHLKFLLERLIREFFEDESIDVYLRPSYFPFTSPSMEVDISYSIKNGKIHLGSGDCKLEILGSGLLHENVLKNMNIDHGKYSGVAFGGGIERLAMLKYHINDIRDFYSGDIMFLKNNKYNNVTI